MKILFVSTQDAARTQLAAGMARVMAPAHVAIESAGRTSGAVHPQAVRALQEVGIDIRAAQARSLHDLDLATIDVVISLSAEPPSAEPPSAEPPSAENVRSPAFAAETESLHWPMDDLTGPPDEDEAQATVRFRAARERLRAHLREYFQRMTDSEDDG
jgi:arsenate reductase